MLLEQLLARARACEDPSVRSVLLNMAALFGLWTMERELSWFLQVEVLEGHHANTIHVSEKEGHMDLFSFVFFWGGVHAAVGLWVGAGRGACAGVLVLFSPYS